MIDTFEVKPLIVAHVFLCWQNRYGSFPSIPTCTLRMAAKRILQSEYYLWNILVAVVLTISAVFREPSVTILINSLGLLTAI